MTEEITPTPAWRLRELIAEREVSCLLRGRADEAVADGDEIGPLYGIPTSVKSHIRVEGMHLAQFGQSSVSDFDDISVERLRRAGAVIVGTNTMMGAGRPRPVTPTTRACSPGSTGKPRP